MGPLTITGNRHEIFLSPGVHFKVNLNAALQREFRYVNVKAPQLLASAERDPDIQPLYQEGDVSIFAKYSISAEGKVEKVEFLNYVVSSYQKKMQEWTDGWLFSPAKVDGVPVPCVIEIRMSMSADQF